MALVTHLGVLATPRTTPFFDRGNGQPICWCTSLFHVHTTSKLRSDSSFSTVSRACRQCRETGFIFGGSWCCDVMEVLSLRAGVRFGLGLEMIEMESGRRGVGMVTRFPPPISPLSPPCFLATETPQCLGGVCHGASYHRP